MKAIGVQSMTKDQLENDDIGIIYRGRVSRDPIPQWEDFLTPVNCDDKEGMRILGLWEQHFAAKNIKTRRVIAQQRKIKGLKTKSGDKVTLEVFQRWYWG